MGRGRKPRAVANTVEVGPPETICSENKEKENVTQTETPTEHVNQLLGATPIVNVAKKPERKHLGSTRRSQRLQSPAAMATSAPVSLDADQDFTIVEGGEEEGLNVTHPRTMAEHGNQLPKPVDGVKKSESKHLDTTAAVATQPSGRFDAERLIQDITVVEGEELPQQGHAAHEMSLKERCDYMEQMLQEHRKILEGLTTRKGTKRNFSDETTLEGEMSYKNLYFESQKKVEALMEENQQLIRKLEKAHGQIEVYEKLMDAIMIPSLPKTKETEATHTFLKTPEMARMPSGRKKPVVTFFLGERSQ